MALEQSFPPSLPLWQPRPPQVASTDSGHPLPRLNRNRRIRHRYYADPDTVVNLTPEDAAKADGGNAAAATDSAAAAHDAGEDEGGSIAPLIVVLILLLLAGAVGYFYWKKKQDEEEAGDPYKDGWLDGPIKVGKPIQTGGEVEMGDRTDGMDDVVPEAAPKLEDLENKFDDDDDDEDEVGARGRATA